MVIINLGARFIVNELNDLSEKLLIVNIQEEY